MFTIFRRSLIEPHMLMGVPRLVLLADGLFAYVYYMVTHSWLTIPISIVVYILSWIASKKDPQFVNVGIIVLLNQKDYYDV